MEVSIYAKAFTSEAAVKLRGIDFEKEFELYGVECSENGIDCDDIGCNRFDALGILRRITKVLNGEGIAWTTYKLEDADGNIAYTFYDLGDGIKAAFFGCGYDITYDISNRECLYAALSVFSDDELNELYREIVHKEVSDRFLCGDKREELINLITTEEDFRWNGTTLTAGPFQKKLRETIIHNFENNSCDNTDSIKPEPGWEAMGIARFSETEKDNLKKTEDSNARNIECDAEKELFVIEDDVLTEYTGNESVVIIPDGITCIGEDAFVDNETIEEAIIPSGVTSLGAGAFSGCTSLKHVVIPDGLKEIGGYEFSGCTALSEIVLPDSVVSIGEEVFCESGIACIRIPKNIDTIPACTYQECSNLIKVIIPDHIRVIGEWSFSSCENLEEVSIPDGVKVIEEGAFSGCAKLRAVTIPESVSEIGDGVFDSCENVVVIVKKGSCAEEYCQNAQINYACTDA